MLELNKKSLSKIVAFIIVLVSVAFLMTFDVLGADNIGITPIETTSNSVKFNVTYPKSGENSNNFGIKSSSSEKWHNFNYTTSGIYTIKSLAPDTDYLVRMTFLLNNKQETIDLNMKTKSIQTTSQPSPSPSTLGYKKITVKEAYDMMQKNKNYFLLDVRDKAEYDKRRIDGAISIPLNELKSRAANELKDKNALILIYCTMGQKSEEASKELVKMGYTNIYNFGGINDWPYATISGSDTTIAQSPTTTKPSTTTKPQTPQYKIITAQEAYDLMQKNKNYFLLDVRDKAEYDEKRIVGAISMPLSELKSRAVNEIKDKNALILTYCSMGKRSEEASIQLTEMGYTNVYNFGKLSDWTYATISGNGTTKPQTPQYKIITAQEAYDLMQKNKNYFLLDVRDKAEYDEKRITGAISMPLSELKSRAVNEIKDKNALILTYCSMGKRSEEASIQLTEMGYTNVYNFGKLSDWPYATTGANIEHDHGNIVPVSTQPSTNLGYKSISAREAHDLMQKNKNHFLLDVRSKKEYDERRIAGAISMPVNEVSKRAENEIKDKNAIIILYCGGDSKSDVAAKELVKLGYKNVYSFG